MSISAGRLRHRVTIEKLTVGRDSIGGVTEVWSPFATRWAEVAPLRGREFFAAEQVNAEVSHRVTLRFLPGVVAKMRVNFGGRILTIEAALNIEERNRELQLMCLEVV